MNKLFKLTCMLGGVALLIASCQKEEDSVFETDIPKPIKEGEEVLITIKATEGSDSKTYIDGTAVKWKADEEQLKVFEVATPKAAGDPEISKATSAVGVTEDSGASMTFGVSFDGKSSENYSSFDYYAFYPNSAFQSGDAPTNVAINTKAAQTPILVDDDPEKPSFDPSADLLIAKGVTGLSSQAATLDMQFGRAVAVARMTIKNLESTDPVTKITFSAKIGETPVKLAGRTSFNLTTGTLVDSFGGNVGETSIILDCSGLGQSANSSTGMTTFFTCYPFTINSTNPGSIKVVVETATQKFTKEVTVNSAKGLSLKAGLASTFSIDMDDIDGESKSVDLCYASLSFAEYHAAGGKNSYGNLTVYKAAHGDAWVTYACESGSAIGIRKYNDTNDSYIKLPDFVDDIKTVVVTLASVTADKALTLETSATGKGGTIASQATTSAVEYTFDLTSGHYKTAYLRSNGFQALVSKIEVYSGTDTRPALAAPASVTASLNDDDANVTNSIDVSWESVDGAASYLIILMDEDTNITTKSAVSSPYTVTDLAYEMEYLISVKAVPADLYVKKASPETDAEDPVTTGADPSGGITLTTSEISAGSNTVQGTNNSQLAYRMGTGDNDGSLTFDAGYETITFTLAGWASGTRSFSITNGTINDSNSLSPSAGSPSGTISASFSTSYSGTEYTIDVTDPTETVVFSGRRAVVWGFHAIEYVPDVRDPAPIAWKNGDDPRTTASVKKVGGVYTWLDPVGSHPTLKITGEMSETDRNKVTYSSSVTSVATIASDTGVITLAGVGETVIKATYPGAAGDTYKHTEVSYTLTVTPYYAVTIETPDHGSFTVKNGETTISTGAEVPAGATINITDITPEDGYALSTLVYNDGSDHDIKAAKSFTMPATAVSITATFESGDPEPTAIYTANFEGASEHRTEGNNSYTSNTYTVGGVQWDLTYADIISNNSLEGSYNCTMRSAKKTNNCPTFTTGNILSSSTTVTKITFQATFNASYHLSHTLEYSTNGGSSWNTLTDARDNEVDASNGYSATFTSVTTSDLRLRFTVTCTGHDTTNSTCDSRIDNIIVYGY